MESIIRALCEIDFTEPEAHIYLYLLKNPGQTPFQISREIHLPRTQIYQIIDKMYEDEKLLLENNSKDLYYAAEPHDLIKQMSTNYTKNFSFLSKELPKIKKEVERQPYINIVGYDDMIGKARTMLYEAKEEVYMNTDLDLMVFDECFAFLEKKGVDVFIFSFVEQTHKRHNVFFYSYHFTNLKPSRLMMSIDSNNVLVANYHQKRDEWQATQTKNTLMVDIITEHIHHDIYLIKLKEKSGASLFELYPDLLLSSKHEKRAQQSAKTKKSQDK